MGTSGSSPPSSSRAGNWTDAPAPLALVEAALDELLLRQKAESRLRAQKRFVSGFAHDLRLPLTVIELSAETIQRKAPAEAERLQAGAAKIMKMVQRSDGIIRDFLDVETATAGGMLRLDPQPMDLVSFVRSVLADLVLVYGARLQLTGSESATGRWDPHAVRRIVENLVSNAAKYGAPDKPITIHVVSKSGDRGLISVHNRGEPIRALARKVIFEPFSRGQSHLKPEGWGLGLAVVRTLTEAHGGVVSLSSSKRSGTRFEVSLPSQT